MMKRFLFTATLLALSIGSVFAQTAVQFGLQAGTNPRNLCVYDNSSSRNCVTMGAIDSTAHTFTLTTPIISGGTIDNATIGATTPSSAAFTTLSGNATTSTTPVLSFNAANTIAAFGTTTANSYNQLVIQNKSATANASSNYVISNDKGTDSSYYGEFGMNSSAFSASTPADFYSINNGVYFSGHDGDISVGSGNGYKLYFPYGSTGASSHVINASGALGFNTNLGTTPATSGTTGFGAANNVLVSGGSSAPPAWSNTLNVSGSYVGIGTASPSYPLHVVSSTLPGIEIQNTSAFNSSIALVDVGGQIALGTYNGSFYMYNGFYNIINVDYYGNTQIGSGLGVGTSAPTLSGSISAVGNITFNTAANNQSYTTTGAGTIAISSGTAGTINNMNIGGTTAAAGSFTTLTGSTSVLSSGAGGVGYTTGSGGTITQATSRTTGVTLNKTSGAITLFTAVGSVTATTFTVTNSTVGANDTISLSEKSGTNLYILAVTAVTAGSFNITFYTTGGVASDAPVINFNVIKGSAN
jgi:hypothetical protein